MIRLESSDAPVASVLILSQDNLEMLRDCLSSIASGTNAAETPYEVLVLFQQMSTQSVERFVANFDGVRRYESRLNLGFGGGNNFLAPFARGRYLVLLNDDATVRAGWLKALVETADSDERIGAVGSRILFPDGRLQEAGSILWSDGSCCPLGRGEQPGSLAYSYVRDVEYASANGMLIRRSTFDEAGCFDGRFFPGYYEDVDLCLTIRHRLKQRVAYEPRSVIFHHESATSNRDRDFKAFLFGRHQGLLKEKWSSALAYCPAPEPESPSAIDRAVMRVRGKLRRILVVDDRVPHAGLGSGFGRTADMLGDLSEGGFAVSFAASDFGSMPQENPFGALGVDIVSQPLLDHLQVAAGRYDAAIISRPHNFQAFYAGMRRMLGDAPIVYDAEALYHRRLLLQTAQENDPVRRVLLQAQADAMEELEVSIAKEADALVGISDSEVEWLEGISPAQVYFMRPLGRDIVAGSPSLSSRHHAVFVAGWLAGARSPNVDALCWYATAVHPRIRAALPEFQTVVTGGNPPLRVQAAAGDGIELCGYIDDIGSLYAASRIAIAPILAGAGVKIKTIESLQYGVPVVATSVGAEGLGLTDGNEIDISDDPEGFARRAIALLTNDDLWRDRRGAAQERIAEWSAGRVSWTHLITETINDRRARRVGAEK